MNKRRGGLGSGLDALLPSAAPSSGTLEVAISTIQQNPRQPRTLFDDSALEELAASIREHGIIQPLIVSERGADRYELVAGERRWRAAQRAGLNPIEEAHAYEALKEDFGLSDGDIARRLGKGSREAIVNTRRLLNLAPEAQQALLRQQISAGHGRALLKLKEAEQQQQALAMMLTDDWTVREAERFGDLVKELGDLDAALAAIRAQRMGRSESIKQTKRAAAPPVPARANATTAEDQ